MVARNEDRILLLTCHSAGFDDVTDRIAHDVDWNYLLSTAADNRLLVPLWRAIRGSPDVPANVLEHLADQASTVQREVAAYKAAFERALPLILQSTDIILLRGIAYAYTIYETRLTRSVGDIDLLIERPQYVSISGRLADHYHVPPPIQQICEGAIEYHHNLNVNANWCASAARFPMGELWERRARIEVAGHRVGILNQEDSIIYLSYHNLTKGFVRLYRWADMLNLIHGSRVDWDVVVERSRQYRVSRAVWLNLHMLNTICPTAVPADVVEAVRPSVLLRRTTQRLLSLSRVLHDPNRCEERTGRVRVELAKKGLLVAVTLIQPWNAHRVLFGFVCRYVLRLYAWIFEWPLVGRCLSGLEGVFRRRGWLSRRRIMNR